jgi:hypothetical protein
MTRFPIPRPASLALALALAALLAHSLAHATPPAGDGSTASMAQVLGRGAMSIGSNGSALSFASSSQGASSRLQVESARNPGYAGVRSSISGETATRSTGVAYSLGSGSGAGWATSAGTVGASAQGSLGPSGANAGGSVATGSSFMIHATRGQGSAVQGSTAAGFETSLDSRRFGVPCVRPAPVATVPVRSGGTAVELSTAGHVSGANASATLAGMNAAGVAQIVAHGEFTGFGQVNATGRMVARP